MFNMLEGFLPLYKPFYIEDMDLCTRAWLRGWQTLFDPRSQVVHDLDLERLVALDQRGPRDLGGLLGELERVIGRDREGVDWRTVKGIVDADLVRQFAGRGSGRCRCRRRDGWPAVASAGGPGYGSWPAGHGGGSRPVRLR